MNETTLDARPVSTQPLGFGLWLSLLAIGLTLTALRGFAGIIMLTSEVGDASTGEAVVQVIAGACGLVALVLLLKRKRAFIPVLATVMVANILAALVALVMLFTSDVELADQGALVPAIVVQMAVSGLWLGYLLKSQHVRAVCVN